MDAQSGSVHEVSATKAHFFVTQRSVPVMLSEWAKMLLALGVPALVTLALIYFELRSARIQRQIADEAHGHVDWRPEKGRPSDNV